MTGYNFSKCMSCDYFYHSLHCCPFTACIRGRLFFHKNGKVVEINLENQDLKKMKEERVYSSTVGIPKQDGTLCHLSLPSSMFKEWKDSPEFKDLSEYKKWKVIQILKNEVG